MASTWSGRVASPAARRSRCSSRSRVRSHSSHSSNSGATGARSSIRIAWTSGSIARAGSRCDIRSTRRRSGETSVGAPLRHTRRGEHFIDPRRAAHLVRSPAAGPSALHRSRLVPPKAMPLAAFPGRVGYLPMTLTSPGTLQLSSAIVPPRQDPNAPRSVLLYTDGMAYVRLGERPDWRGPTLFGPVGDAAQRVGLSSGGVAYYEPASDGLGRRLAIHASATNLFLESNLPRAQLLVLAASLPVRGEPLPDAWTTVSGSGIAVQQVAPADALARSPVPVVLPSNLPAGYVLVSASVASDATGPTTVSFVFRQRERHGRRADRPERAAGQRASPGVLCSSAPRRPRRNQRALDAGSRSARMDPGRCVRLVPGPTRSECRAPAGVAGRRRRGGVGP